MRQLTVTAFFFVFVLASTVAAQPFGRTFVSAQLGNDANSCIPTAPCRTFAKALTNVSSGGEIVVLDSGGYGPNVTIDKAVSISAVGVYAGITTASGDSITIAAALNARVSLRGLTLNGVGAVNGIVNDTSHYVDIDNIVINGYTGNGVMCTGAVSSPFATPR